jgi:zinc transport system substrate-binding protein
MRGSIKRTIAGVAVCFVIILIALPVISCNQGKNSDGRVVVAVSILPQVEFVENISGGNVDVAVMIPPGADPHTYEPLASQMAKLSRAIIYAKVGSGLEFELGWMDKFTEVNKAMLVVDCARGITLLQTTEDEEHGEHKQGGADPHIWMSPVNAVIMVRNICDGMVKVDPAQKEYYESNRDVYMRKLSLLDKDYREGLAGLKNRYFMTFHPSFGYLAREYDLHMMTIAAEGKEPTAAGITGLIEQAKKNNVKVVFASPQFNIQSAKVIAGEIKGKMVTVDTLSKDYINNMRMILSNMVEAMQ